MGLVVLATSIWMAADASSHGYDKRDIEGLAALGPIGWLVAGILLWIVAFPLYLFKRNELIAAGRRRRELMAARMPVLPPGAVPPPTPRLVYGQPPPYAPPPVHPAAHASPSPYAPPPVHPAAHASPSPYAPPPPREPPPAEASPTPKSATEALADQLVALDQMRRSGLLTDAEFDQQKARLLARR